MLGCHVVASRHFLISTALIFQNGFIAGLPPMDCCPVPSNAAGPELIKCRKPFVAAPDSLCPVTRLTASGLQYVRTSAKTCAVLVSRYPNNMLPAFSESFSVATM